MITRILRRLPEAARWASIPFLLCLSLAGCQFHSVQPLLIVTTEPPFDVANLTFEERQLDEGAWAHPHRYQLRRTGPGTYAEPPSEHFLLGHRSGHTVQFERLRPGFYAAMWRTNGEESGFPAGYYYELIYLDSIGEHAYRWNLGQYINMGRGGRAPFYTFCSSLHGGPSAERPGAPVTFNDRATLLTVLNGCLSEIVRRRIPPTYRLRFM